MPFVFELGNECSFRLNERLFVFRHHDDPSAMIVTTFSIQLSVVNCQCMRMILSSNGAAVPSTYLPSVQRTAAVSAFSCIGSEKLPILSATPRF